MRHANQLRIADFQPCWDSLNWSQDDKSKIWFCYKSTEKFEERKHMAVFNFTEVYFTAEVGRTYFYTLTGLYLSLLTFSLDENNKHIEWGEQFPFGVQLRITITWSIMFKVKTRIMPKVVGKVNKFVILYHALFKFQLMYKLSFPFNLNDSFRNNGTDLCSSARPTCTSISS